jgi:hypothetical protein
LRQNGGNLFRFQVRDRPFRFFLRWNAEHLGTLSGRGRLAIGYEQEKTPQRRQSAVAGGDRSAAGGFDMLKKREDLRGGQVILCG